MKDIHIQVCDEYATVLSVTAIGTAQQGTQVQTNVSTLAIDLTNGNSNGDRTGNIMYEIIPKPKKWIEKSNIVRGDYLVCPHCNRIFDVELLNMAKYALNFCPTCGNQVITNE